MSENIEPIEQYLRGVAPPRCVSEAHRHRLRRRVLDEVQRRRTIPLRGLSWKLAAAALVCVAGAAGAFLQGRYHAGGPQLPGAYRLISENPTRASDAGGAAAAVLAGKDLESVDPLRPQDNLKLVSVIESEVDGRLDSRTFLCRYALADGRTKAGGDPNEVENPLTTLPAAAWTEISQLRRAGQGENLGTQVMQVKGRPFVFTRERFTLHNGMKVVLSVGEPREAEDAHP